MALPKKYRLTDKSEIEKVFKKGRIINSSLFLIRFLSNHLVFSRFTVIVSSKISKKAVIRNRIKRRLKEIIRLNILKIKPGYNFIVIAKPKILNQKHNELTELLVKELGRITK